MRLPAELVDHIFSLLRGDISALKACSKSHPCFSQLAERYLFADIIIGTTDGFVVSEIYKKLSKDPRILDHARTLAIFDDGLSPLSVFIREASLIPRMANLVSLTLCAPNIYPNIVPKLQECLQHSPLEQISLIHFRNFPLSALDNCKNLKKLTLSDCSVIDDDNSDSPLHLEELSIHGYFNINLLNWLKNKVAYLKSLHLLVEYDYWHLFPELLSACSNSLTRLHLAMSDLSSKQKSFFWENTRSVRFWVRENRRFPFNLSEHNCLKQLSISARVFPTEIGPLVGFAGALPAIMNLIKTASAIQEVDLRLHWVDFTSFALGRLDYAQLCPNVSHIRLCISGDYNDVPISPTSILESLAENEVLMDLVGRGVVTLRCCTSLSDDVF